MADKPADKQTDKTPQAPAPSAQTTAPPQPAPTPPQPPNGQQQPGQPPEEKVVSKDEARALFEGGHRLKKKGARPDEWLAATRLHGQLCLVQPLTEDLEKKVLGEELVLVPD